MPTAELPACVFCGEPIGPGEETAGRGSSIAHAACADRALADDAHWEAIHAAGGAADETPVASSDAGSRRAGCLAVMVAGLAMPAILLLPA